MKLKELKHNHSLTDLLKILIFSLLMLAPIMSVASRCLYVICNKNAYESYYGETINQHTNKQIDIQDFEVNNTYYFYNDLLVNNLPTFNNPLDLQVSNLVINNIEKEQTNLRFYRSGTNPNYAITLQISGANVSTSNYNLSTTQISMSFTFLNYSSQNYTQLLNPYFYTIEYNNYSYLDNVFEYSVHSLEDNQLFNWTKNTAVYTGVNAMTSNLEIEGSVIPILITYWFLLTIIYVIIDIVLKLFTILTHMIGNKTA